ncbi:MAG: hypothetical protein ACK5XN_04680 [Bacteroidota bacterium]|jgi:hypothetical protein
MPILGKNDDDGENEDGDDDENEDGDENEFIELVLGEYELLNMRNF